MKLQIICKIKTTEDSLQRFWKRTAGRGLTVDGSRVDVWKTLRSLGEKPLEGAAFTEGWKGSLRFRLPIDQVEGVADHLRKLLKI